MVNGTNARDERSMEGRHEEVGVCARDSRTDAARGRDFYDRVSRLPLSPPRPTHTTSHQHLPLPLTSTKHQSFTAMMLAASPFYSQPISTPARPSPLSERSANVLSRPFSFTMAAPSHNAKAPVPQRAHKPNPVIQSRDAVAQRRREMFFRRVQKDRDDKKWDARGDQVCVDFSDAYGVVVYANRH